MRRAQPTVCCSPPPAVITEGQQMHGDPHGSINVVQWVRGDIAEVDRYLGSRRGPRS
jgi:hypothetical protein